MPTPFTHLRTAQDLLNDKTLSQADRALLDRHCPAFLLGSIAADARVSSGLGRDHTHFYSYDGAITRHPWRLMFDHYPTLTRPSSDAHRAFLAGYVAHLAVDEYWTLHLTRPYFFGADWGESGMFRFIALHLVLIAMDERDEAALPAHHASTLARAEPAGWLPFLPDDVMQQWRNLISGQLQNNSQTLMILGERIGKRPAELRQMLDSAETMHSHVWQHVPPDTIQTTEAAMYDFARQQMSSYLRESDA